MEKLQKIQIEEHSGKMILLLEQSKKTLGVKDVLSIRFIPTPWYALHKVSFTQRSNYIINLVLLTFICGLVSLMVAPFAIVVPVFIFYSLIFLLGVGLLIASPKKTTSLEIKTNEESIKMKDLSNNQVTELYYQLKSVLVNQFKDATLIMETKVIRNPLLNASCFIISLLALLFFYNKAIGLIPLILFFFYCLLLCGSLAFNSSYNPKIQVALHPTGLKFIEFKGKYEGKEHVIESHMIERLNFDKSQVIGLVRKSRKSILTNTEHKEVIPHYNRIDLHFFHQAYLPLKKYRPIAPFFIHWLNEEISGKKINQIDSNQ